MPLLVSWSNLAFEPGFETLTLDASQQQTKTATTQRLSLLRHHPPEGLCLHRHSHERLCLGCHPSEWLCLGYLETLLDSRLFCPPLAPLFSYLPLSQVLT